MDAYFWRVGLFALALPLFLTEAGAGADVEASGAQGVGITLYDTGLGMVRERRLIPFEQGENRVLISRVPASLDVASLHMSPPPATLGLEPLDMILRDDLRDVAHTLRQARGSRVLVVLAGANAIGQLQEVMASGEQLAALSLRRDDGTVQVVRWEEILSVQVLEASSVLHTSPTLVWRVMSERNQPQSVRINYIAGGMHWRAEYELIMNERQDTATLSGRLGLSNRSGGDFSDARIRLVATDQGEKSRLQGSPALSAPRTQRLRYLYRSSTLADAETFDSLSPVFSHEIGQGVALRDGEEKFFPYFTADGIPVTRSYIYDGVQFDQFQRNRRSDWNYGTESRSAVEVYISFRNEAATGLGKPLAPGFFRLMQETAPGVVDLLGGTALGVVPPDHAASIRLGPARGLTGERERISYTEVVPLHEYEETFEIRLRNDLEQDVVIQVVEHLYRWSNYEIMRADTEYEQVGEDSIQFNPVVKAGGSRTLRYTVRYRW